MPAAVVRCVVEQLGMEVGAALDAYRASRWRWRHPLEIRHHYGYRNIGEGSVGFRLGRWLFALCWTGSERPSVVLLDPVVVDADLRDAAFARVPPDTLAQALASDRRAYAFCVLDALHTALRRRDAFVTPNWRYADPRAGLLAGADWAAAHPIVCRTLGLTADPQPALTALAAELDQTYRAVAARLPRVELPEILLEVAARTGFTDAFTHLTERAARAADLTASLCAVLLAEACNTGPEPLIRADEPALKRDRLSWVDRNYLRVDTLSAANAVLVAAQHRLPLAHAWGGGEVASADGMRFVVPVRTLHAGPNPKYFGQQKGVTGTTCSRTSSPD